MVKNNPKDFDTLSKLILTSMMSECSKSFERLPICVMHPLSVIYYIPVSGRNMNMYRQRRKRGGNLSEKSL